MFNSVIQKKDEIHFDTFSFQYIAISQIVIVAVLINLKDMKSIMKVVRYGFVSNVLFLGFIGYGLVRNMAENGGI